MTRITSIPVIAAAMLSMSAVSAHAMDVYNCKELIHCLNNSMDVTLMNDIKMDYNAYKDYIDFNHTCCYKANFDGQGHKIYGIWGRGYSVTNSGLIHWCDGATVKNVTVEYDRLTCYSTVGGIAGAAKNSTFENCHVKGILLTDNSDDGYTGGIVGKGDKCKFYNCTFDGNICADGICAGGIVAYTNGHTEIHDCHVTGYVGAKGSGNIFRTDGYVGGMVGKMDYSKGSTISNCINDARVESNGCYIGGIVGGTKSESGCGSWLGITNCTNTGAVAGQGDARFIGGIIGFPCYTTMVIENCTTTGNISGDDYIGGIYGSFSNNHETMEIRNCNVSGRIYTEGDNLPLCGYDYDAVWSTYVGAKGCKDTARYFRNDNEFDPYKKINRTQSLDTDFDVQPAEPVKKDVAKKVMVNGKLTLVKANGQTVDISGMMR